MKMRAFAYELPLRHVFRISRGAIQVQPSVIVELEQDGQRGYGEATTNDYYDVTIKSLQAALKSARPTVESYELGTPEQLWERLEPILGSQPFAQCAVDQAAYDLWGKLQGQPVYRLWNLDPATAPPTNYTIGIDSLDRMIEKLRELPDWPVYKIKLGTPFDLEIVQRLREETDAVFRVDANCAWTAEQTLRNAAAMRDVGVEFIEQPLPADQWDAMRRIYPDVALPVVADESCIVEADVERCHGCFHGINIKLVKCGGLTPARRMIERARSLGLKVMVGCMTESTVGISAIAQLAPLLDYVDMDGAVLLAEDIAEGVTIRQGRALYDDSPGSVRKLTRPGQPLSLD